MLFVILAVLWSGVIATKFDRNNTINLNTAPKNLPENLWYLLKPPHSDDLHIALQPQNIWEEESYSGEELDQEFGSFPDKIASFLSRLLLHENNKVENNKVENNKLENNKLENKLENNKLENKKLENNKLENNKAENKFENKETEIKESENELEKNKLEKLLSENDRRAERPSSGTQTTLPNVQNNKLGELMFTPDMFPETEQFCVSFCEEERDVISSININTGEVMFCNDKGDGDLTEFKILSPITSQQCSQANIAAIAKHPITAGSLNWTLFDPSGNKTQYTTTWIPLQYPYQLSILHLPTLPLHLPTLPLMLPGEYTITTPQGKGSIRLFTLVCYDTTSPRSYTKSVQVLCEAKGVVYGTVSFSWEIPVQENTISEKQGHSEDMGNKPRGGTARVGTMIVTSNSSDTDYNVEEYVMGTSPISVLSVPPSAQRVRRSVITCKVRARCGCEVTQQVSLVIWDLTPHHNVTQQYQTGHVTVTVLGSDSSWPDGIWEASREDNEGVVRSRDNEGVVGFRIHRHMNDKGEMVLELVVPKRETGKIGRQAYVLSVSYRGKVKSTELYLHVIQVDQSPDVTLQVEQKGLQASFSLSVWGGLIVPASVVWSHETILNKYKTISTFLRTTLTVSEVVTEQQTHISLSYTVVVLGSATPHLHLNAHFLLTTYTCNVLFPSLLVCPSDPPPCYETTVYQRGVCTCSFGLRGTCTEPGLQAVTCPAMSEWRLSEWSGEECRYTQCGVAAVVTRTRQCTCQGTVDNSKCGEVDLVQAVDCGARDYAWTDWSAVQCPRNSCYTRTLRRYRLCQCLGDVDFGKCVGEAVQRVICKPDKMCFLD